MTEEMMNLRALVEKTPDADLLREMIGFAAHRLMELEVEGLTGAAYGEKTPDRIAQRNASSDADIPFLENPFFRDSGFARTSMTVIAPALFSRAINTSSERPS